jgi:myo-inositol catabolism protein IolS
MQYRKLGTTGLDVSVIALGCWPFAGGEYWGETDDAVSIATVHAALDAGINFFDTAEGYEEGKSERVLGEALIGRRGEAIVATKVNASNLRPDDIVTACDRSLANLQMDYVDLYQIHWPNHDVPLADSVGTLQRLKEQGKIRAIGVSNFAVQDLNDVTALTHIETDQLPYSLFWRVIEKQVQPLLVEKGIGIICYSPLAQGLLTGRYTNADAVPEGLTQSRWYSSERPLAGHGEPGVESEVFQAIDELRALAEEAGLSMATMALAWVKSRPAVTSFLVGARTPEELSWNLPVADVELPAELIARLDAATADIKDKLGENPDMWAVPGRMR